MKPWSNSKGLSKQIWIFSSTHKRKASVHKSLGAMNYYSFSVPFTHLSLWPKHGALVTKTRGADERRYQTHCVLGSQYRCEGGLILIQRVHRVRASFRVGQSEERLVWRETWWQQLWKSRWNSVFLCHLWLKVKLRRMKIGRRELQMWPRHLV